MSDAAMVRTCLTSGDLGDRLRAVNAIRSLPQEEAFELIQLAVQDNNPRVRYAAVSQFDTLGHCDRAKSLEILQRCLLEDSEGDVQAAAADCLGALKLTEAFDNLAAVYNSSPEWLVRFSIISALGELGDPRGFDLLAKALTAENGLERLGAIGGLGELGDPRAIGLLLPLIQDEDWQVRHRVAQALGNLNDPAARPALETLATDPIEQVASAAQLGLAPTRT